MACGDASLPSFLVTALGALDDKYVKIIDDAVFMCSMREYLIQDMLIDTYREAVAANLATALGYLSTAIVTIWVAYQGFMIIGGSNKTPILPLLYKSGKIVLVMALMTLIAGHSPAIADAVLGFQELITAAIVGEGTDVYRIIDINLALGQVFNALIDGLVGGKQAGASGKELTTMAGLVGQSGPAMLVSVLAIMAEISITLAIMLAPLFIFFLLFQQTASMFWTWVKFLLGTMVSLAVLALLSGILLKMMMVYGATVLAAFYVNALATGLVSIDIGGSAMRMASMGALASALIMLIPPLIMQFFNSGASFATGAMMGMMGGGAAGGALNLARQLGNQGVGGSAGGAGAQGALGNSGNPGGTGSIGYDGGSGSDSMSSMNNRFLHAKANNLGSGGETSGSGWNSTVGAQGSKGLLASNSTSGNPATNPLREMQAGPEFRKQADSGTGTSSEDVSGRTSRRAAAMATAEDVVDKSGDRSLGTGGQLRVDGDGGGSVGGTKALNSASVQTRGGHLTNEPKVVPGNSAALTPSDRVGSTNAALRGAHGKANQVG